MNPVDITIPDNIEELIAAYLLGKAEQLRAAAPPSSQYLALYIGTSAYRGNPLEMCAWASTEVSDDRGVPTTRGTNIGEIVDLHLSAIESFDPLAMKKAKRDKLNAEIAELEGGSR